MMNPQLQAEVVRRLKSGKSLDGLGLEKFNGRIDLRGLVLPEPTVRERRQTFFGTVATASGKTEFENVDFEGLDFSRAYLKDLLISNCRIHNCLLDHSNCQNIRVWGTEFHECSFRKADLSGSALGGTLGKQRNHFRAVDFSVADLRGASFAGGGAKFTECIFKDANLLKVGFEGSVFEDCQFAGKLREVQFYRLGFKAEGFPPNEMKRVDMSEAMLHFVEFRGLDVRDVRWPSDDQHIIVHNYRKALDYVLAQLKDRLDLSARKFVAVLNHRRKWAGANQLAGIFNKKDLVEIGGEAGAIEILDLLRESSNLEKSLLPFSDDPL